MDNESKSCSKCNEVKPFEQFYKQKGRYVAACKKCANDATRKNNLKDHDAYKARMKKWYEDNKEYAHLKAKQKIESDRGRHAVYVKTWATKNADAIANAQRARRAKNPDYSAAQCAKRRAAKFNATPKWADMVEIASVYATAATFKKAGVSVQVDHIVPLVSHLVCGLHTHDNLQILPSKMNTAKKNHFWPNMPDESLRKF